MEADDPVKQLRNNLNCSICLEVFTNPLTLQCGHSFCRRCIHEHWDRETATSSFSCPECRINVFPRPEPLKNVSLSKLVDEMKAIERSRVLVATVQTDAYAHNAVSALCQRHHQALALYCSTDSRCICSICLLKDCRQHDVQDVGELSQQEKKKLLDDLRDSDHQQKHMEEEIKKWKCKIENIKDFHEKILSGMMAKFEQVRKALDECQILVVESVNCEKDAALTQAGEHVLLLQSHLADLEKHCTEAEKLLKNDATAFLEGLPQLLSVGAPPGSPSVQLCGNLQMEAVTKILPEVTRLLQQELPNLLHHEKPIDNCKETSVVPPRIALIDASCLSGTLKTSLSDQKTPSHKSPARICELRTKLLKDFRNLKFDPETASKYIELSHENCKATHKSLIRGNDVPDSPKRFKTWQVMCTEGFSEGSHYWEVGISTFFVELGVAYGSLERTNKHENIIGRNGYSWSLQLRSMHHSVWHNNKETKLQSPMFPEIGIHLDLQAGILTFYGIEDGGLQHLHSFSCLFSEKVFPVFFIGEDINVTIRTIPNAAVDAANRA